MQKDKLYHEPQFLAEIKENHIFLPTTQLKVVRAKSRGHKLKGHRFQLTNSDPDDQLQYQFDNDFINGSLHW